MGIKRRSRIIISLVAALVIAAFIAFKLSGFGVEDLLNYTPENLFLAALFLILVYCLHSVVMVIPLVIFYVAAGMLFPIPYAILVTCLGLLAELTLGYLIGYFQGKERIDSLLSEYGKIKQFFGKINENQPTACFISRILPLPFDLVSIFLGANRMPFGKYILFSMIGLTPGMIPFVITGKNITNPLSKEFLIPFGIGLVLAVATLFIYLKIVSNQRDHKNVSGAADNI